MQKRTTRTIDFQKAEKSYRVTFKAFRYSSVQSQTNNINGFSSVTPKTQTQIVK